MINREMDLVQHSLRNLSPLGRKVDLKIVIISASPNFWIIFCVHKAGYFTRVLATLLTSQVKKNGFCLLYLSALISHSCPKQKRKIHRAKSVVFCVRNPTSV